MADGLFTPGTGTLKSTDLINAFAECAMRAQIEERKCITVEEQNGTLSANGLTVPNFINIQANLDLYTYTISIPALPVTFGLDGSGNITVEAIDYLEPISAVAPVIDHTLVVTGADIVKPSKIGALLELAQKIQADEALLGEDNPNRLTISFNGDLNTTTIAATFDMDPTVNNVGNTELPMINYLVV